MIDISAIAHGLTVGSDGVWRATEKVDIAYPRDGNSICYGVEDNSFWFAHRNRCLLAVMSRCPPPNHGVLFDIGGGNGVVSAYLSRAGYEVVLVEPGADGVHNALNRGVANIICSTFDEAGFNSGVMPSAGLFDVLEHVEDDISFLRAICGTLVPGGKLYVTVPAYKFLWSAEDKRAQHFRRYTLGLLARKLRAAGFDIEFGTYIFQFLPIPVFLLRTLPNLIGIVRTDKSTARAAKDHAQRGGITGEILRTVLDREIRVLERGGKLHFGASCLMVARRGVEASA